MTGERTERTERILITGGRGYMGGRLASALALDGYRVLIHDLDGEDADVTADVTNPSAVLHAFQKATEGGKIDFVIHLAAVNELVCAKDLKLAFAVNCFGTQYALDAAVAVGVKRFLYMSTFHAYGDVHSPITERTVTNPLHPYGITHLVAEQFCKAVGKKSGMEVAIIRFSNGVGVPARAEVDRWSLLMLDLCRQAQMKGSLTLHTAGHQLRDFTSFDDLAQAVRILLTVEKSQLADPVFNVGAGQAVSVRDLARTIQAQYEHLYHKVLPLHIAEDGSSPGGELKFSIDRIKALGYKPTTDLAREARETLRFCENAFRHNS